MNFKVIYVDWFTGIILNKSYQRDYSNIKGIPFDSIEQAKQHIEVQRKKVHNIEFHIFKIDDDKTSLYSKLSLNIENKL